MTRTIIEFTFTALLLSLPFWGSWVYFIVTGKMVEF